MFSYSSTHFSSNRYPSRHSSRNRSSPGSKALPFQETHIQTARTTPPSAATLPARIKNLTCNEVDFWYGFSSSDCPTTTRILFTPANSVGSSFCFYTHVSSYTSYTQDLDKNREICLFGREGDGDTFQKLSRPFARLWKTLASSLTSVIVAITGIDEAQIARK